jgi:hypothetical protein
MRDAGCATAVPRRIFFFMPLNALLRTLAATALCAIPCVAQTTVVKAGATVRFRLAAGDPYRQGQLAQLTADSLIVERCPLCNGRLRYGRVELERLDVSRRVDGGSRVAKGVLIGGGAGLLAGVASEATCHGGPRCEFAALAIPFLTFVGAAVGGIAAYLSSYVWESVKL